MQYSERDPTLIPLMQGEMQDNKKEGANKG